MEGVSTRKVKDITEELCGITFSKSLISSLAGRLDARYVKVRVGGRVVSQGSW